MRGIPTTLRFGIRMFWAMLCLVQSHGNIWAQHAAASFEVDGIVELHPQEKMCSFHLHTEVHALLTQVFGCYGLESSSDTTVPTRQVSLDIEEVPFDVALEAVQLVTGTFAVPVTPTRALLFADTAENRRLHEHIALGTLRLIGMSPAEINDVHGVLRSLLESSHYSLQPGAGELTMRAPAQELLPLYAMLSELLNGRSEVLLEAEFYEIDKSRTRDVGVTLPGSTQLFNVASEVSRILATNADAIKQIVANGLADAGDYQKIIAILIASGVLKDSAFNSPFLVFGGGLTEMGLNVGNVAADLVLNSSEVRSLKQAQLRLLDREEGSLRVGTRYPILVSSTANVGSSSSSAQFVPQIEYENLGINLKATPHINQSGEVALALDLTISALTGQSIGDLPVLSNRQYTGEVVLHSGQSALVVGVMAKQTDTDKTGTAVTSATHRSGTSNVMEIVLMVTPHILRLSHDTLAGAVFLTPAR
jgi:hypothetical protein